MAEGKNHLKGVHISYNESHETYKKMYFKSAFEFLEKSLTEKYGTPSYRKVDEEYDEKWNVFVSEEYDVSWNLPSTVIELYYRFTDGFAPSRAALAYDYKLMGKIPPADDHTGGWGSLNLKYRQVEKEILDKF